MKLFNDFEFLSKDLFYVDFNYNESMREPFFKDVFNLFKNVKSKNGGFTYSFCNYLYAAHKACAYLTMFSNLYSTRTLPMLYEVSYEFLCRANCHEGEPEMFSPHGSDLFEPYEILFVQQLTLAILYVKNNPTIPFELIELYENHVTDFHRVTEDYNRLVTMRKSLSEMSRHHENIKKYDQMMLASDWERIMKDYYNPLKEISDKYHQGIAVNTQLVANGWNDSCWYDENLSLWICTDSSLCSASVTTPQYKEDIAKHFLNFWKDADERNIVLNAIKEWSAQHLESFSDMVLDDMRKNNYDEYIKYLNGVSIIDNEQLKSHSKQAIKSLENYLDILNATSIEDTKQGDDIISNQVHASPIRLNCGEDEENDIIDFVRVFYVMHELCMFSHVDKSKLSKTDLFNSLAIFFDFPQLKDWSNKMSSSRSQVNNNSQCHHKIFDTMKKKMIEIQEKLDKKKECI